MDKTWSCWRVSAGATETKRLWGASLRMRRCLRAFPTFASLQPRSRQSVRPLLCPGNSHEKPAFQRFLLGEAFVYFSHCRFNQKVLIKTARSDFITVLIYLSLTCLLTGGKWKCHYSSRYLFICLFICELNLQNVVCCFNTYTLRQTCFSVADKVYLISFYLIHSTLKIFNEGTLHAERNSAYLFRIKCIP